MRRACAGPGSSGTRSLAWTGQPAIAGAHDALAHGTVAGTRSGVRIGARVVAEDAVREAGQVGLPAVAVVVALPVVG